MKHTIIYILVGVSILLGFRSKAFAQHPNELLEIAIAANQQLQALKLDYQAALEKAPQVSQLPNPEIGIGAYILPVETRLGPQHARISVTQMFPWFGTLQAQEDWAIKEARAKFERIAATELEIRYRLASAYYALYELQASQLIIERNIALFESLKYLAEAKVATGKSTLADVLRIDLKIDELTQKIQLLENRIQKPTVEINQLLYRDLAIPILVVDNLSFVALSMDKDTLLEQVKLTHPMLRMFELQQEASNAVIEVNRLQGKPSFGLGADYINTGQRSDALPLNNGRDALQLRASISIPLYRIKYQAKQREEEFRINALEAQKQETLSRFEAMIEKAYTDYEEARLDFSLYNQQIETTQAAIEILKAEYAGHSRGFDDLLQLEVALLNYELAQLKAVAKSYIAKASIERYLRY